MVSYITRSEFIGFTDSADEIVTLRKSASEAPYTNSTFLSYNSKDDDILPGVIKILRNHGATVYIDKIDASLPSKTGRETAAKLRDRIRLCRKFVTLASTNSKDSKWVPWELGLADGYRNPSNVAVFPAVDSVSDVAWTEREYLGIYDRIVWGKLNNEPKECWLVWNHEENTAVTLATWLGRY